MTQIHVKRIYEEANRSDGFRVLVGRLWPRGISKEQAALDLWLKTVAPSTGLRQWFGHDLKRWKEFAKRYRAELRDHGSELAELRSRGRKGPLTLLFAARDSDHNEAVVLKAVLEQRRR